MRELADVTAYGFETRRVPVVVRDRPPLVPVTVNVKVPRGVRAVLIVRIDVPVGATVTEVGLNEPDDPDGSPLTDSETAPANPFSDVTVTV